MKKKLWLSILVAAMAATAVCGLAACGDDETKPCEEHSWNSGVITRAATCALAGEMTFTCTVCKETKTEPIEKLTTHTWDEGVVDQPDLTVEGTITYTCTVCGETSEDTVPAHLEHTWDEGNQLQAPTCSEKGTMKYECTYCHTTKTEDIPKVGHTYTVLVETTAEATCKEAGSAIYKCAYCEETQNKEIPATGEHTYGWVQETEEHYKQCSVCQNIDEETRGSHDMKQVVNEEATLYKTGLRHGACKCGKETAAMSYELDGYVTDYRSGIVAENTSGWSYGKSDYNWSAPTEGRLPGTPSNNESFVFTESTEFNGDAWILKNGDDIVSEIKAGWLNGSWSTLAYTVGEGVTNASYKAALNYKYTPADSHANLYTTANVRVAVLSSDGTCKYSEFIGLNGNGDGNGTNAERDISGLNAGDKIYVFIELAEAKEKNDQGEDINSSWSNGDFTCRIFDNAADSE